MGKFKYAIEMGGAYTCIYVKGEGLALKEPTLIAAEPTEEGYKVVAMGIDAKKLVGKTKENVEIFTPSASGDHSNYEYSVILLKHFLSKVGFKPYDDSAVFIVPCGLSAKEKTNILNVCEGANLGRVELVPSVLCSCIGAGRSVDTSKVSMVVDIGGGTTDIAVLTMNAVATSSSLKVAGNAFDEAIAWYIRKTHGVVIGPTTAEDIKIQIGCVAARSEDLSMLVKGRDAKTGVPRELTISSSDIFEVLRRPAKMIVDAVQAVLEDTSPELVGDIATNGITLTGGGCQIAGMDQLLYERTGITCTIADDPESCVAYGCGKSLKWINAMNEGPINIARKRLMREL